MTNLARSGDATFEPLAGDFTPFGYLRNPAHVATSWHETSGGNLRTAPDRVGVEWAYPVGRNPTTRVGLGLETVVDGRRCRTRTDFDAIGLTSRYHSCLIFGFDWQIDGVQVEARFFLANDHALGLRLSVTNHAPEARPVQIALCAWVDAQNVTPPGGTQPWLLTEAPCAHVILRPRSTDAVPADQAPAAGQAVGVETPPMAELAVDGVPEAPAPAAHAPPAVELLGSETIPGGGAGLIGLESASGAGAAAAPEPAELIGEELIGPERASGAGAAAGPEPAFGAVLIGAELAPGAVALRLCVLARGAGLDDAVAAGRAAVRQAEPTFARLLAEDAHFQARCPTLVGDWPAGWRAGLVYDFETTRLLVQPAGGIFGDVWPSWMAAWPRVVFAEGTLDMLRLAYADPALAQRAVLSLFRDAPQPNVPCVFQGGEYNMVAADGSRCGTSPAWCLPFLSLELLYLRTLDRAWLRQIYPYACAFVEWWLEHRVDAEGWVVYKCTWESGEDGNPRLDPTGTGDADISARVRPVELQATMTHAAGVLALFAAELELWADVRHWQAVEAAYRARTQKLFDPQAGRYRDWVTGPPRSESAAAQLYWGIDPHRFSVQSLTPLLIGEPLANAEILRHVCPPWTLWPSWTTTLIESAAAAGLCAAMGALAFETIDRVYRVTTRRQLGSLARPLPGCAPEFWPADWRTFDGSDAYGWGATTATLLIRHLFGFKESRATDGWSVELAPAFPEVLLNSGRTYGIRHLNYRGLVFDLTYTVRPDRTLVAELDLGSQARTCSVIERGVGHSVYASQHAAARHRFPLPLGQACTLRLG